MSSPSVITQTQGNLSYEEKGQLGTENGAIFIINTVSK